MTQTSLKQEHIPKEAPWKTSALNEQFRKKRNREFSTVTSGTERERGFVGIRSCFKRTFDPLTNHSLSFILKVLSLAIPLF